jgi:acyl carrier protein
MTQTPLEAELAELIVETLKLNEVKPQQIEPEAPLFGEGLGLDSIDALELSLGLANRYGVQIRSDGEENQRIFASLRALASYVEQNAQT